MTFPLSCCKNLGLNVAALGMLLLVLYTFLPSNTDQNHQLGYWIWRESDLGLAEEELPLLLY
jgi:hypothetical protein